MLKGPAADPAFELERGFGGRANHQFALGHAQTMVTPIREIAEGIPVGALIKPIRVP